MIDPQLDGRVALVTGANQGIGAATALALAEQGVAVALTYLRYDESNPGVQSVKRDEYLQARSAGPEKVIEAIVALGGRSVSLEADLARPASIPEVFDAAERALGPVEILVNNADFWIGDTFLPSDTDQFGRGLTPVTAESHDQSFIVNSRATALLIQEFAHRHIEREASWGRIIGLTTGPASGFPGEVTYGASKNALESYHVAAAHELGRYGITSNIVCPPATDTGWMSSEMKQQITAMPPLFHVGQPDEVAEVITFLASEQARYVTGQRIVMS